MCKFQMRITIILTIVSLLCCSSSLTGEACNRGSIKVIALLGDSMTWIGGDSCQLETGWSHYLVEAFPSARIKTFARSGATWTNTISTKGDTDHYTELLNDENVIYNQVRRLILEVQSDSTSYPDIIVAFAGGNDAMFSKKRPFLFDDTKGMPGGNTIDIKPSEVVSLSSSVELSCRLLQQFFPKAKLFLVTPTQMSKASPEMVHQVSQTIARVGNNLGIEVLRADNDVDIKYEAEKRKGHKYTYDGVHTNPQGASLIADFIIKHIKSGSNSNLNPNW